MKRGYFITLEGIEGAGKSTVLQFIADFLRQKDIEVVITREPGGTEIAEKIRTILLSHHHEVMHHDTEMLLYFAGRAQHLHKVILPALEEGKWVLCDRFTDATYAYQGGGRGISMERIAILEEWVQKKIRPDVTFLLDVDVEVGMQRIKKDRTLDRFEVEANSFFERIRKCYLEMAAKEPKRYQVIDANKPPESVIKQIEAVLCKLVD